MDNRKLMEQLRKTVREVIQEELKSGMSSYDATAGISTTALTKDGKPVGYVKHKTTDRGGLVAGGRIGPKAVEKMGKTDETKNRYSLEEFIGMMEEAGYKFNKK